ncbi:AcrR family transcriptional regulator [Paenibacillus sp. LBL]|uniref:TetR/AcrR family transcriptional regulator n=1 Tax=Paenibacillus sp. LBL TaxID=2940563 RepID=UPI00247671F7|nr:TetR/AcrR family transcriptional regulator [Paenibacillus sp. LBL]MDH6675624.1 AcrR family transcriptional regulator [Paenibacillus sp. LBL]
MSNTRRKDILSSASYIIEHSGMEKLTLDAVAKHAGISKGGLLHHFPNKESIIQGLIEEYGNAFFLEVKKNANEDEHMGRWNRSYIETSFNDKKTTSALSNSLLAVLFSNPELMTSYQRDNNLIQEEMSKDGIDIVSATIIKLASDGLWLAELLGIGTLNEELRHKVKDKLMNLTYNNN